MVIIYNMCWKCGNSIESGKVIGRQTVCPFCGNYLHCCKNCKFYDVGSHYDCHETVDELVTDKESANFCDYFSPKNSFVAGKNGFTQQGGSDAKDKARDAFNSLFGN